MPTGYTAAIADGISFEKFVWTCARAFGALITLRDDAEAPVPEHFEPSAHYAVTLADLEKQRASLVTMSTEEISAAAYESYRAERKRYEEQVARASTLRMQYDDMAARVTAWTPPEQCAQLKTFMLEQIATSIEYDCSVPDDTPSVPTDLSAWRTDQVTETDRSTAYYTKANREEIERVELRNAWVSALRASVPLEAAK